MTGFFISKLPSGHAVKDNTKAAAIASLRGEDIVKATPANTVPLLRQQCAAIVRLRRDVCTADNLEKLALADRAYLLKLCGLLGGGTSKARSRCILDRPNLHPGDGGSPPRGGGGGGPARGRGLIQQRGPIGQQLNGRRRRRRRRGVSTRDAPLFGCGFCTQSSRSGGLGPPPRRSWRTLRLWRQCFNPARQARRH